MSVWLPAVFVTLAACSLWAMIGAKGKWWLKLPLVVAVPLLGFPVALALGSLPGWPTRDSPPQRALLVSGQVREPDSRTGDRGRIFLWLVPLKASPSLLAYRPAADEPRAYSVPYSRQLHRALEQALKRAASGTLVVAERGSRGRSGRPGAYRTPPASWRFYALPPPVLPPKGR